ncbi:hypothetical protein [Pantoea sp. 18069]|uniref:hypothetical protein n=1 Tax=Pantoea sp. 18069 TaxID=2681415 RepID=UPI0013573840|nr:hypothetical protein [Pantoea sp. 18069]
MIKADELEAALLYIENIVERVFCEPLNTAQIFGDPFLDSACEQIGRLSLRGCTAHPDAGSYRDRGGAVFIASRLQASGGHTAVLADIACRMQGPVTIVITGVVGATDLSAIQHAFRAAPGLEFICVPAGSRLGKLQWLQACLQAINPETVWLANHHQDSVAVSAVQPGQGYALKYLHHGDHHLCLGVFLSFGEHYDLHSMGFWNCRDVLHHKENQYLPLIVADPGLDSAKARGAPSAEIVSCTAAGKNKIEHAYWPDYADVIADVLAKTGGKHLHVGRLSWLYRRKIRRALARRQVPSSALEFIPYVPSVARFLQERQVDLYLASFPYAGARTAVEAMAAGVAIAGHDHSGKRFLGAVDMLPVGSCVWSTPDQLMTFLSANDTVTLRQLGCQARLHYEKYHSPESLMKALQFGVNESGFPPQPMPRPSDELDAALLRSAQFTFSGVLKRRGLRCFRAVKAFLSRFR